MDNSIKVAILTFIAALAAFVGTTVINAASPSLSLPGVIALVLGFAAFAGTGGYLLVSDRQTKGRALLASLGIAAGLVSVLGAWFNALTVKKARDLQAFSNVHMVLQQTQMPNGSLSASLLVQNKAGRVIWIPRYVLTSGYGIYHETTYRDVRPQRLNILDNTTSTVPVAVYPPGTPSAEIVGEFELRMEGTDIRRMARVTFQADMVAGKYDPLTLRIVDEDLIGKVDVAKQNLAGTKGELTIDLTDEDGPKWAVGAWNEARRVKKEFRYSEIDKQALFTIEYRDDNGDTISSAPDLRSNKANYPHTLGLVWDDASKRYAFKFDRLSTPLIDFEKALRGEKIEGMQLERIERSQP